MMTLMNAAARAPKKITLGAHVAFTAECAELCGRDSNCIYEITDSRHVGGGEYVFSLTPVTLPATLNAAYTGVWADDLRFIG